MNAVERLNAAIERLETLRVESGPGAWRSEEAVHESISLEPVHFDPHGVELCWMHGYGWEGTADLIVTLHRTIDAQLAILRGALEVERAWPLKDGGRSALALADAILGES